MFGQGLIKGLQITLGWFFRKKVTVQYPEERCPIAARFHGKFVFDYDKCIGCSLCANACPNKVIKIASDTVEKKKVVKSYTMDLQYCLFCGLCVEACNKNAIKFSDFFEMAVYHHDQIALDMVEPAQVEAKKELVRKEAAAKAAADAAKAKAEQSSPEAAPRKEGD